MRTPDEIRAYQHAWYLKNKDKITAQGKADYIKNREKRRAANRVWYQANKELRARRNAEKTSEERAATRAYGRAYFIKHKDRLRAQNRAWDLKNRDRCRASTMRSNQRNRLDALIRYGGSPPKCACCGEDKYQFLAIDHPNNDGAAHRKEIRKGKPYWKVGVMMVNWLKRNAYPPGFRILCHNCNSARQYYGYCHNDAIETFEDHMEFLEKRRLILQSNRRRT